MKKAFGQTRYTAPMENDRRSGIVRFVRISFSAACVIVCVLLAALWVRSYAVNEVLGTYSGGMYYSLQCLCGRISVSRSTPNAGQTVTSWRQPVTEGIRKLAHNRESWMGFQYYYRPRPERLRVKVPIWFLFMLVASSGALPWLRWRFSLRTLLIATTLVAVVLGLVVYAVG